MRGSAFDSLDQLRWAHATVLRLVEVIQYHSYIGDRQKECAVQLGKAAVLLEGLIADYEPKARRRPNDTQGS